MRRVLGGPLEAAQAASKDTLARREAGCAQSGGLCATLISVGGRLLREVCRTVALSPPQIPVPLLFWPRHPPLPRALEAKALDGCRCAICQVHICPGWPPLPRSAARFRGNHMAGAAGSLHRSKTGPTASLNLLLICFHSSNIHGAPTMGQPAAEDARMKGSTPLHAGRDQGIGERGSCAYGSGRSWGL